VKDARLLIDRIIAPALRSSAVRALAQYCATPEEHEQLSYCLDNAMKFDCKALPLEFVLQTGQEKHQELLETGEDSHLPFGACIFEFHDFAVVAQVTGMYYPAGEVTDESIALFPDGMDEEEHYDLIAGHVLPVTSDPQALANCIDPHFEIGSRQALQRGWEDVGDGGPFEYRSVNMINADHDNRLLEQGALALLGVLTLFEERLLVNTKRPSVPDAVNRRRETAGVKPMPPHRVLTLNLAETRRRAKTASAQKHESPMLHWRRGHWRTLGRKSEFETRTWVKRCLVGDPDKGFVAKHYKTIWQQTIH
jgi:hypothetical protein